jgi:hypothetical protein
MGHIVQAASTAFQPCAVGFPLGMEQFWSLRDYSFTLQALMRRLIKRSSLLLDSGVLANQQLNEGTKQRFASLADVVNKLEKTQIKREFLL